MVLVEFFKKAGVDMSEALEAYLLRTLTLINYKKGDLFCEQGHVCRQLGFMVEGQAALHYLTGEKEFTRWVGLQYLFETSFDGLINSDKNSILSYGEQAMPIFQIKGIV